MYHDDADQFGFSGDPTATFDYDPSPDFDGMEYDDLRREPKCGGVVMVDDGRAGVNVGCQGCRHCFPPDYEAIHTGFEVYDRPDFYRVRSEMLCTSRFGYCLNPMTDAGRSYLLRVVGFSPKLLRAACCKLSAICDRCETHPEAVAEYESWVKFVKSKINY